MFELIYLLVHDKMHKTNTQKSNYPNHRKLFFNDLTCYLIDNDWCNDM